MALLPNSLAPLGTIAATEGSSDSNLHARVSDYLTSGTFSGADIKVLIHYNDIKSKAKEIQNRINGLNSTEEQLNNEYRTLFQLVKNSELKNNNLAASAFKKQLDAKANEIDVIGDQVSSLEDKLASLGALPATQVLGELQTISYSVFREKEPVRTLGSVYPRGFTRGPRTIAGSMIFTVFHEHVLHEVLSLDLGFISTGAHDYDKNAYTTALPDQLPPLTISLVFNNEYGASSHMVLYGVEFVQEGSTFSIQDIYTENVVQYVARDFDPMHTAKNRAFSRQGIDEAWSTTASDLSDEILRTEGTRLRRNPFI